MRYQRGKDSPCVWAMRPKLLDGYSYFSKKIMNLSIFDQNEIDLLFDLGNLEFPPHCNVYI